ncbi:response regulator transcription factor [Streptomyces sp. DH24]|uniref:response regulator transcription factor n=1 Tax=Streptomyces sp. DH24 TaxID=3040123 RepID=UPI0024423EFC|nr:response regulator transcription factor [Streptomyces sp. DH24]MDG9720195.1 response regulator transcription factor [Streptomyces sp. DH24]
MIRVLLADGQPLLRSGLRVLLDAEDDIEVVAEAADGRQVLELVRRYLPDIVLTDIRLPVVDGIEAIRRITGDPALARTRVVVLTAGGSDGSDVHVFEALRAGAAGLLINDVAPADLLHALRVVARGDALLAPSVTRKLINRLVARPLSLPTAPGLGALTDREREAVALVARGLSTSQIADRMVISPLTVKSHIDRAKSKLRARGRVHLVGLAYASGLVAPENR